MKKSLLLVDGNSIIYRAYFGIAGRSDMRAPDGTPTGALYAFMNIYFKFLEEINPDHVCVCFDVKGPTFRHKEYPEYKATRKPMPEDLQKQIPILIRILETMGVPKVEAEGYEADDLIGSISASAKEKDWKTYILSGDKDDLQLVGEDISVIMPTTRKSQTQTHIYDTDTVEEKYGIQPSQFVDLKALMGDASDNIPGVKGIGEKGAVKLLKEFGDLDTIYSSLDKIPPRISEKLEKQKEMAYLSKSLATIKKDLPTKDYFNHILEAEPDDDKAYELFTELGFKSIIGKLGLENSDKANDRKREYDNKVGKKKIKHLKVEDLILEISDRELYRFDIKDLYDINAMIKASGIAEGVFSDTLRNITVFEDRGFICILPVEGNKVFIDCNSENFFCIDADEFDSLADYLKENKIRIVCNEIKDFLKTSCEDTFNLLIFDITVAAYLLNQFEGKPSLTRIAAACLGGNCFELAAIAQEGDKQQSFFEDAKTLGTEDKDREDEKSKMRLALLAGTAMKQIEILFERGSHILALCIEMPLACILAEMEKEGFKLDTKVLDSFNSEIGKKISEKEKTIHRMAGEEFNINSPKQLAVILFEKLGLPTGQKGQTGYSTKIEVLEMLKDKHPIIEEIIVYRQLSKLKSTFIEGLSNSIDSNDGRVHTTFHQTLTSTGRLSSSNPNLQNIPIKLEEGREIRKAFIAEDDKILLDADYSQIELRLLAAFSGDENMMDSFLNDVDIHTKTAKELFDVTEDMITPHMRSIAKTINFSIVYGIGEYSLSVDLGIPVKKAGLYIKEYHKKYPKVKPYFDSLIKEAYDKGYVETLFKRRRYIKELKSANRNLVSFGERAAMNTPLQGTAADIMKIATVILYKRLKEEKCNAKIILQVHDELVLESNKNDVKKASELLNDSMEQAVKLSVPLVAKVEEKKSWYG